MGSRATVERACRQRTDWRREQEGQCDEGGTVSRRVPWALAARTRPAE